MPHATRAFTLLAVIFIGLGGCHRDTPAPPPATPPVAPPPVDTTPTDLSKLHAALPPAMPDTFTRPKPAQYGAPSIDYPPAPAPLMDAVTREQGFSRFCYEEFGQKADPTLRGGVAVLVTVADNVVQDAKVANSRWSAKGPGAQVNQCLDEKARLAWKLGDAVVKPGKYVVQLTFRGE